MDCVSNSSSAVSSTSSSSFSTFSTCSTSSAFSEYTSLSDALQDVNTDDIQSNSNLLRAAKSWAYYLDGRRRYHYQPHTNDGGSCQHNNGHSQCSRQLSEEIDENINPSHNHHFQYTTSLEHVAGDSFSTPALQDITMRGLTGVKRVFGVAFFLGLIPILGPILYTYLTYHRIYRPLLNIKIGRISRAELQTIMKIYLFLDLMLGLFLPIIGPVLRAMYLQPALRMTDIAKAKILEHGKVCLRAYNQVAALIGYTSEPRSILLSLERISIQTIPPALPRLLSRSFPLTRHCRRPCVQPYAGGPGIMGQLQQQTLASIHRLPGNVLGFQRHQHSICQPTEAFSRSTMTFSGRDATSSLSCVTFSSLEFAYHYQHDHNPHFPYHFHDGNNGNRINYLGTKSCVDRSYSSLRRASEVEDNSTRSPCSSFLGSSEVAVENKKLSLENGSEQVSASQKLLTECAMPSTLLDVKDSEMQSHEPPLRLSLILSMPQDACEPYLKCTSTTQVVVSCGDPALDEESIPEVVIVPNSESPQGTKVLISSVVTSHSPQSTVSLPLSLPLESLPHHSQPLSGCDPSHARKMYLMGHNYPFNWLRDVQEDGSQDHGSNSTETSSCQVQHEHGSSRDSTHDSSSNKRVVEASVQDKQSCENETRYEMAMPLPMIPVGGALTLPSNGVPSPSPGYRQLNGRL